MYKPEREEVLIYETICSNDGIKAKNIAKTTGIDRTTVNRHLFGSRFMNALCYQDHDFNWHGTIRQMFPHEGLWEHCAWYGTVREFLGETEETWFSELTAGCERIGRNLNDTRGLFHSFRDCAGVLRGLFEALEEIGFSYFRNWEICFELRINRARYLRIFADVLLITENKVFSLEFKMKPQIDPAEAEQAAKYCPYLEVVFGSHYDVIPALVLTAARDLYCYVPLPGEDGTLPVCSGDMLFNLLDDYIGVFPENHPLEDL